MKGSEAPSLSRTLKHAVETNASAGEIEGLVRRSLEVFSSSFELFLSKRWLVVPCRMAQGLVGDSELRNQLLLTLDAYEKSSLEHGDLLRECNTAYILSDVVAKLAKEFYPSYAVLLELFRRLREAAGNDLLPSDVRAEASYSSTRLGTAFSLTLNEPLGLAGDEEV